MELLGPDAELHGIDGQPIVLAPCDRNAYILGLRLNQAECGLLAVTGIVQSLVDSPRRSASEAGHMLETAINLGPDTPGVVLRREGSVALLGSVETYLERVHAGGHASNDANYRKVMRMVCEVGCVSARPEAIMAAVHHYTAGVRQARKQPLHRDITKATLQGLYRLMSRPDLVTMKEPKA